MTNELPPQSELDQIPPYSQELVDEWHYCLTLVQGQLAAYDRLVERGEPLSEVSTDEIEDLLELEEMYKRFLDGRR